MKTEVIKQITDCLQIIASINRSLFKLGSDNIINTDPLMKAFDAFIKDETLEEKHIRAYYTEIIKLDEFYMIVNEYASIDTYMPYSLEYNMFGLTYEDYAELDEYNKNVLSNNYSKASCDYRSKKTNLDVTMNDIPSILAIHKHARVAS